MSRPAYSCDSRRTNASDPNVAAGALQALGALRAPHSYDLLVHALNAPSFLEAISSGALQGLAAYGG
jgi:hypothetical protein